MCATKTNKVNRKNFRFTDQVAGMLKDRAAELDQTENELVADAVFSYLSDRKEFVICPSCDAYIVRVEKIPAMEGVMEAVCKKCGTQIWFDLDVQKIIKTKKVNEAKV